MRARASAGIVRSQSRVGRVDLRLATAARVVALGSRVLVPARNHPRLARIAVIADPAGAGASAGLWQALAPEA
jgi:predicted enzyme related to lactoylglutathione lyase